MIRKTEPVIYAKAAEPQVSGKCWYRISAKADEKGETEAIEVFIYEEIGLWGIDAGRFIKDFNAIDDGKSPVVVAINSPGGNLFDGVAMNGWMQRLGERVTARIDGMAASAASIIAVGAKNVVIGESAMMMIHNPSTYVFGDAGDLRNAADKVEKARDSCIAAYRRKAPAIDEAELIRMLDDETWLSAEDAVALGLADAISEHTEIKACRGTTGILACFKHPPQALLAEADSADDAPAPASHSDPAPVPDPAPTPDPAPAPDPAPEQKPEQKPNPDDPKPDPASAQDAAQIVARSAARIAQACLKAGIPELAEEIIMNTPLTDENAVAAETARVQAVRDLCLAAKLPELAADYVKAGLPADAVRARLFDRLVQAGGPEIDNKQPSVPKDDEKEKPAKANISAKEIYAKRKSITKAKGA